MYLTKTKNSVINLNWLYDNGPMFNKQKHFTDWISHWSIECFHSRGQHLCKCIGTKGGVCIRRELNSHRICLGHQHGRRDVMWKHSIVPSIWRRSWQKTVFLRAMPLTFSLTTETKILVRWRMANEASSLNSALLRTFSLIALFFSRKRKGSKCIRSNLCFPMF